MKVFADYALLFVLSCLLSTTVLAQGQAETQQRVEISFAGRLAGRGRLRLRFLQVHDSIL